jgi:retron-type reverse transcriptase
MNQRSIKFVGGGVSGKISGDHNIFEEIISLENLFLAWQEFKKGKIGKTDVQSFNLFLEDNIFNLYYQLVNKTYRHSNYTSFYIKDPKLRHIHKACVRDRVLHHAIFRILYPIFDNSFIFDSYSCRNNKGTHKAINRLDCFARKANKNNAKTIYILKLDIKKFFDSIDHNVLLFLIKKKIKDKNAVWLIEIIINSFSTESSKGIPLGNITSQLFANIYLNELDYYIKHNLRIKYYIRYCDDFVILDDNKEYLDKLIPIIDSFLKERLKLSLHPDKIIIKKHHQGIDFLGYVSFPCHKILRTKTKRRMFKRIRQRINSESFEQTFQSYLGVLKHCNGYKLKKELSFLN